MNLDSLNAKQKEAVLNPKHTLVIAGAGTGKTRVLTYRIAYLIAQGVDDRYIYAFTFTNKAAKEMKNRLSQLLRNFVDCNISTFHSFFFQELNLNASQIGFEYPISIIDSDDEIKIIKQIIKDNELKIKDTEAFKYISNIKNSIKNKYQNIEQEITVAFIFKKLQKRLNNLNRMDFDDILYYYNYLLDIDQRYLSEMREVFKYVLIDESQDMNIIQYEIIRKLSKYAKSVFMVGDQDQCIYTFRGSNLELINRFELDFKAKRILLEENYRSTRNILDSANNVIKHNFARLEKNLFTRNKDGNYKIHYRGFHTDKDESNYVTELILRLEEVGYKPGEIAILYRNNMVSNQFEKEMILRHIPYTIYGSYPFFMHKEVKSLINHFIFFQNQQDDLVLEMILRYPKNRISEGEIEKLKQDQKEKNISLYQAIIESKNEKNIRQLSELMELKRLFNETDLRDFIDILYNKIEILEVIKQEKNAKEKLARLLEFKNYLIEFSDNNENENIQNFINDIYLQNQKEKKSDSVSLMTIHQAKGLEFKVVILVGCNQGILPSNKAHDANNEEERRLFYVGITRAKERLFLTSATRRFINGKPTLLAASPFLLEMGIFD